MEDSERMVGDKGKAGARRQPLTSPPRRGFQARFVLLLIALAAFAQQAAAQATTCRWDEAYQAYKALDLQPQFNGDLMEWLMRHLEPYALEGRDCPERIVASFVVAASGAVTQVRMKKSSGSPRFDNQVLALLRKMPRWTPGRCGGGAVPAYFELPVSFRCE